MLCISTLPALLFVLWLSLLTGWVAFPLISLPLLTSAGTVSVAETPAEGITLMGWGFGGAVHREISHSLPVKLVILKEALFHFRQALPERSRARRRSLIAP